MPYHVRNDSGYLIAKMENRLALDAMNNLQGYFREYKEEGKAPVKAFEVTKDRSISIDGITIYLFTGTTFIPV